MGTFKSPNPQPYDKIASNHIQEIGQWVSNVCYLPGKKNVFADLLSRPTEVAAVKLTTIDLGSIASAQQNCPDVKSHKSGQKPRSARTEQRTLQ